MRSLGTGPWSYRGGRGTGPSGSTHGCFVAGPLEDGPIDDGSLRDEPADLREDRGVAPHYASLLDPPIGFAHRGARAHARENTLEAFALALRLGAKGLETDAWITADGIVVLDHDGTVRRRGRQRAIAAIGRADLPAHIPTLGGLVALCAADTHVSIDLKDPRAGALVIDEVQRTRPDLLPRLWLCMASVDDLVALRPLDPQVRLVNSTHLKSMKGGPERRAAALAEQGIDAVNLHHTEWTPGLTALFHRFDRCCFAWDLQHEHLLRRILEFGMDGVYSDWVDRMNDALIAYQLG